MKDTDRLDRNANVFMWAAATFPFVCLAIYGVLKKISLLI